MAIVFDTSGSALDTSGCISYKAATTTFTVHSTSTTDFDYFDDDFGVGDYMLFGRRYGCWHDLVVTVGTAIAATSYTLEWQIFNSGSWTSLSVIDGTNGFSTTGTNTVSFTPTTLWSGTRPTGVTSANWFIRAIITAVDTPTEGGANITTRPTASDYAITVTGTGNRLSDLQSANDSGGWGMMTTLNSYTNCLCNIYVGNSSTESELIIKDNEYLEIGHSSLKGRVIITTSNSTLQVGELTSGNYLGASVLKQWANFGGAYVVSRGTIKAYNSLLLWDTSTYWQLSCVMDFVNTVIGNNNTNSGFYISSGSSGSIKNLTVETGSSSSFLIYSSISIDNLIFGNCSAVLVGVNNVVIANTDFGTDKSFRVSNSNVSSIARNCTFVDNNAQTTTSSTGTVAHIEQTLTFTILDEKNETITSPTIRVIDGLGTELFNGTWTDDLNVEVFRKSYPSVTVDYNPIEFWVSKAGYETVYKKITLTANNRMQEIKLRRSVSAGRDNMGSEFK